jgi:TolA-binding protein
VAPELTQLLQTMARDLANMHQGIEQLKVSQEQMASDNVKAVDELKAGQEQMTQLIAKVSEQNPKPSTPPSRPVANPTRRPVPTRPSP